MWFKNQKSVIICNNIVCTIISYLSTHSAISVRIDPYKDVHEHVICWDLAGHHSEGPSPVDHELNRLRDAQYHNDKVGKGQVGLSIGWVHWCFSFFLLQITANITSEFPKIPMTPMTKNKRESAMIVFLWGWHQREGHVMKSRGKVILHWSIAYKLQRNTV